MNGGNRGGSRPPAINSVAGKEETSANIEQGKQRTITQMFFNPPPGIPGPGPPPIGCFHLEIRNSH